MKSEERICSDCGARLSPAAQDGLCVRCLFTLGLKTEAGSEVAATAVPITEKAGDRIGRYKLLQKIGEGGCGVVYMAEQEEPVRRRVALKVIKLGMDTREVIARFEQERQALAMMDHPNIAKIFDAGATDAPTRDPDRDRSPVAAATMAKEPGEPATTPPSVERAATGDRSRSVLSAGRPYFVMELVRGARITEYCDQHNLSTRERLDLFIKVCQAIQHAHQKGIIHRDIKPSNILVTVNDGVPVPKVIDFGIAKAIEGRLTDKTLFTAFQQFMGTPAYMSPEQAEMTSLDIDTRSDIYSLGVLLYELLTGKTPFDAKELLASGLDAMRRTIREQEPMRPSTRLSTLLAADLSEIARRRHTDPPRLMHLLRGDLDWIVMKCLEKDRTRRYEVANGLAADIQRHLNNEPVLASPPGNLYRFQKVMRRHKLAFAAAAAVLASLVIGLGAATVMFFKERSARRSGDIARSEVVRQKTEVERKKAEVELKNAEVERKNDEFRAMLVEAARSDRLVAEEKLRLGQEQGAFAHLARACEYDPPSTLAAEKGIAALGVWNHELPTVILAGHEQRVWSAQFSPDGMRIVTASADNTARVWNAATGKPLVTLAGHENELRSAQFSPDGTRIVTVGGKTASVWDVATGKTLATFAGHEGWVYSAQFSPDGTRIVSASSNTARVWDAATGKTLAALAGHEGQLESAQFSPDGSRIVTSSHDQTARVWDATTGKTLATLAGHKGLVRSAQYSPDGTRIVTASDDKTARVWDAASSKPLVTLGGHEGWVYSAQFSPDSTRIVTWSEDKFTRVWDAATGKTLATLTGQVAEFSPDGTRIVTARSEESARVWNAATGKSLAALAGHRGVVWSARFSPDGTRIVTASEDKTVRVWDAATGKTQAMLTGHKGWVWGAQFSPDGTRIVTADNKTARVWNAATGKPLATLVGHSQSVSSVRFSPNGKCIVTTSADKTARVWDAVTGKTLAMVLGHEATPWSAQFSPDGTRIVSASSNTARVWDPASGKTLAALAGHEGQVKTAWFSPDGTRIVTASWDKTARVWDAATGKTLATLAGHEGWVNSAQFSPEGTRIVTASNDKTARVWEAATGKTLATLAGHEGEVQTSQFSPDGTSIVTASWDTTARVWDAATGKTLATLVGHEGWLWSAQYSQDGTRIVTASSDKSARVWDPVSGKAVATLAGHTQSVRSAQFSPDCTRIVTESLDRTACLWDVLTPRGGPPPEWFPDFLRYMAQMRLNPDGELETLQAADWLALRERLRAVLRASAGADTLYLRILRKYVRE